MSVLSLFCIGSIPVALFIFLRLFVRDVLGIHLGYRFITDYDFVPQTLIAFVVLTIVLFKKQNLKLRLQKDLLTLTILFLLIFMGATTRFQSMIAYNHPVFVIFWFVLAAFTVICSAFLFVRPTFYLKHSQRILILPAMVIASTNLISVGLLKSFWEPMAHVSGLLTYGFLKPFMPSITYHLHFAKVPTGVDEYTVLSSREFELFIGSGCSGFEGICFFITVIGLLYMIDRARFAKIDWLWMGVAGIMYMYVLNIFRLVIFFLVSVGATRLWGETAGVATLRALLHGGLAWIMYSVGLALFFAVSSKFFEVRPGQCEKPSPTTLIKIEA